MSYVRNSRFRELFKKPGSSVWWAFIPNPAGGRMLRETTGHRDERAAHKWYLARVREPVQRSDQASDQKERSLVNALDGRIAWLKAARMHDDPSRKKPSLATIEFYTKKSRQVVRVLGGATLLSEIGHEEIRKYIVQRTTETAKAVTIAKELTALSMAMRLARKDGVRCEAFRDIKPEDFAAIYVPRTRWLTEAEVDALIEILPPKRGAVVAFIVATSATYPSEVARSVPSGVNVKTGDVHIPGTKRSTRDRRLRVPSHARRYLAFAAKHMPFESWHNVRGDLLEACRKLSLCPTCRDLPQVNAIKYNDRPTPRPTERYPAGRMQIVGSRRWCAAHGRPFQPTVKNERCRACKTWPKFAPLSPNDLRRTFVQWLVRSGVPNELVYPMAGHTDDRMVKLVYGKRDASAVSSLVEMALKRAPDGARTGASRVPAKVKHA